jgi:hypothetical protein
MNSCYGYTPDCVLSKGDDCTRQRQTCCETGTQSRESFGIHPRGMGLLQKIVWLPKAIGESRFSEFALFSVNQLEQLPGHSGESSRTTRELCVSRKAPSLFSPSFFFPLSHSSFLNRRLTCNRGLSVRAVAAVGCGKSWTTWSNSDPTVCAQRR